MTSARLALLSAATAAVAGCEGRQSALDPQGPGAERIADLFWLFTGVSAAVWLAVMAALAAALLRQRPLPADEPLRLDPAREGRMARLVAVLVLATAAVLVGLTGASYLVNKSLAEMGGEDALRIRVTGQQWWWQVRYESAEPARTLTTANEIHIPVGRPVRLTLASSDVIHSFWVPSLMGKQDLVTGRENELVLTARRPGVYRGQCAEFCGWQHARMAILVVAEEPEAFQAWYEAQLAPAAEPASAAARRGRDVFLSKACILCHAVQGTPAGGRTGPDLTHVGSRRSLAAGTLPNSRGALAAWIADPQAIKPGSRMPNVPLSGDELDAVAAYLAGLQ